MHKETFNLRPPHELWDYADPDFMDIDDNPFENINGIYNDDGTKVDSETIPTPNLCVK